MAFCERLCFEMRTDLEETRLQLLILPVNVYTEDTIVVSRQTKSVVSTIGFPWRSKNT